MVILIGLVMVVYLLVGFALTFKACDALAFHVAGLKAKSKEFSATIYFALAVTWWVMIPAILIQFGE